MRFLGEEDIASSLIVLIHRSAWKVNSPKSISTIVYNPACIVLENSQFIQPTPYCQAQHIGTVNKYSLWREFPGTQ